jgi:hypothetical protein
MLNTTGNSVEIVIDNGLDFTLGDFPEGFAAKDLANLIAPKVKWLQSIRITTPRVKSLNGPTPFTYDYVFQGKMADRRWGYTHRVSEHVIRSWIGGPVVVSETNQPRARIDIEYVASQIAREINEGVLRLLTENARQ